MSAERAARIVLRPIGNPLPLGFLALSGGTLLVSALQLGWLQPAEDHQVALILIAFVVPLPAAVLATTAVRFAATGLYQLTASGTWKDVADVIGLVLCALGLYAAAAMALEDARRETVLPLGRRGAGATAVGGDVQGQLERIEREAGVREQL